MIYGSLCTGIGGLDLAVEAHFGAEPAWCCELDPAPSSVIERHWPGLHNYGDLKALEWAENPVDIITAGYPCQPFSHAGKRKGTDDPRHLWPHIIEGVRRVRPRYVVLENVRGHLTLGFDAVLGDLAEAGFDAEWCLLRASDVGAPHARARIFVVARNTDRPSEDSHAAPGASRCRVGERRGDAADSSRTGPQGQRVTSRAGEEVAGSGSRVASAADAPDLRHERSWPAWRRWEGSANDGGPAPDAHLASGEARHGRSGAGDAGRLQPLVAIDPPVAWGAYEPAIRRWGRALGRCAPQPVDDAGRLSPDFVAWMMGYPAGWVDGLGRTAALKALGNAVVPQQALAALCELAPCAEVAA